MFMYSSLLALSYLLSLFDLSVDRAIHDANLVAFSASNLRSNCLMQSWQPAGTTRRTNQFQHEIYQDRSVADSQNYSSGL